MAPHKSRQAQASTSEDENEQQSSQDDAMEMLNTAKDIFSKGNERRDKKRKVIEGEHDKRIRDSKVKMDTVFAARRSRVSKSHQAVWARLDTLDKKRQNIESLILASMKTIETQSSYLSDELVAMFGGRIEEMEEIRTHN
ncbi:uncharacterized protein RSE6_02806 [Rhynchosporium secalis]|uniref:Uncharacterized protein n=1 Tax=Rhynchosporium secalis TaxID=38038 RepID=A0A1E1M161_RHYSE|nr:uncharacterized protein RSE6_02806 [Rhynchosporium secalis]